jgi:hypothetical protein
MPATYKKIASGTVTGSATSTIEFTSIPSTYTDLFVFLSGRSSRSGANIDEIYVRLNGNTGNFSNRYIQGSGIAAPSSGAGSYAIWAGYLPAASATASTFSNTMIYIPNYTVSQNKSISIDGVQEDNATAGYGTMHAVLWNVTDAITSITLDPLHGNFEVNSTATLYGILKA